MHSTGAEIVVRALQDEGVTHVFGTGRGRPVHLRRDLQAGQVSAHLGRTSRPRFTRPMRISRSSQAPVGVALVTQRPASPMPSPALRGLYGLDPGGHHHRTGPTPCDRAGTPSRSADTVGITRPCVKHNFAREDVRELAATIKEGVLQAQTGTRSRAGRRSQGRDDCAHRVFVSARDRHAFLQARRQGSLRGRSRRRSSCCSVAERPMIYTGGGVILSDSADLVTGW